MEYYNTQYNIPSYAIRNKIWDPFQVLSIINQDPGYQTITCNGTILQGRRCRVAIRMDNRAMITNVLDNLSYIDPNHPSVTRTLKSIVGSSLCVRFHQNQASAVLAGWEWNIKQLIQDTKPAIIPGFSVQANEFCYPLDDLRCRNSRNACNIENNSTGSTGNMFTPKVDVQSNSTYSVQDVQNSERLQRRLALERQIQDLKKQLELEDELDRLKAVAAQRQKDKETAEKARQENERLQQERAQRERLERERLQQERLRAEQEAKAKKEREEEAARKEAERAKEAAEAAKRAADAARDERARQRAENLKREQERKQREQQQKEERERTRKAEWEHRWTKYTQDWSKFRACVVREGAVRDKIPWPVRSDSYRDVKASEVKDFFKSAMPSGERTKTLLRKECLNWHPDSVARSLRGFEVTDSDRMMFDMICKVLTELLNNCS